MKHILLIGILISSITNLQAQNIKNLIKKATNKDTSSASVLNKVAKTITGNSGDSLSTNDVVTGLKEALATGTDKAATRLSTVDGFFKDAAIKILMPDEAKKVEQKLRSVGLGNQVDNAILSMNRAAEDAAKNATPIFVNAIKEMSIADAWGILKGGDFAATNYLKQKTTAALTTAFRPVIEQSLAKVDATKYWNTVFTTYNRFSKEQVNTDLAAFVTEKALNGIFYQIQLEEQKIRKDPLSRTSDILKKVFAKQ